MSCACHPVEGSYANLDDLASAGIAPGAIGSVTYTDQQRALERASRLADTYLRDRYTLPLCCPFDQALVDAVVQIASYRIMVRRGFNPNTPGDATIRMGYDDALAFLKGVANEQLQLCVAQSQPEAFQPMVGSSPTRGYGGNGAIDLPIVGPNGFGF